MFPFKNPELCSVPEQIGQVLGVIVAFGIIVGIPIFLIWFFSKRNRIKRAIAKAEKQLAMLEAEIYKCRAQLQEAVIALEAKRREMLELSYIPATPEAGSAPNETNPAAPAPEAYDAVPVPEREEITRAEPRHTFTDPSIESLYQPSRTRKPSLIPKRKDFVRSEFIAVDFETANNSKESACQVSLVKFSNGVPGEKFTSFIRPPRGFGRFVHTKIHGITSDMVADAPNWAEIVNEVSSFVGDLPVFAHNASFDRGVWEALDAYYGFSTVPKEFYCSMYIARRFLPELPNHKLPTVLAACAPGFKLNHHEAESDALACGYIVTTFQNQEDKLTYL